MYGASIGIKAWSVLDLITAFKQGLPFKVLAELESQLLIPEAKLAAAVDIPKSTLSRRAEEGRFTCSESERLFRIVRISERAVEVLGSNESARSWFQAPVSALGGKAPLEYIDTEIGAREVENILGRIQHGVLS